MRVHVECVADYQEAARSVGLQIRVVKASNEPIKHVEFGLLTVCVAPDSDQEVLARGERSTGHPAGIEPFPSSA
jgi:hypothetical protein